jgi:hypothetical protein
MSALPLKADIARQCLNVRFVPEADIGQRSLDAFIGQGEHLLAAVLRLITTVNLTLARPTQSTPKGMLQGR